MIADIAMFDAATIADKATFDKPQQFAVGMRHVLVNGQPVLLDGADDQGPPRPRGPRPRHGQDARNAERLRPPHAGLMLRADFSGEFDAPRFSSPLPATVALAACDRGPEVDLTNATPAEVAKAMKDSGATRTMVRPGKWSSTVAVLEMNSPGMPPEMQAMMKQQHRPAAHGRGVPDRRAGRQSRADAGPDPGELPL